MNLEQFISIFSILSGFMASIYFCAGTLELRKEDIYQESKTGFGGHTPRISINLAKQRSEFLCGSMLLMVTFALQLILFFNLSLLEKNITANFSYGIALSILLLVVLIFLLNAVRYLADKQLIKYIKQKEKN